MAQPVIKWLSKLGRATQFRLNLLDVLGCQRWPSRHTTAIISRHARRRENMIGHAQSALAIISGALPLSGVRTPVAGPVDLPLWRCLDPDCPALDRTASDPIWRGHRRYPAHAAIARHTHQHRY